MNGFVCTSWTITPNAVDLGSAQLYWSQCNFQRSQASVCQRQRYPSPHDSDRGRWDSPWSRAGEGRTQAGRLISDVLVQKSVTLLLCAVTTRQPRLHISRGSPRAWVCSAGHPHSLCSLPAACGMRAEHASCSNTPRTGLLHSLAWSAHSCLYRWPGRVCPLQCCGTPTARHAPFLGTHQHLQCFLSSSRTPHGAGRLPLSTSPAAGWLPFTFLE